MLRKEEKMKERTKERRRKKERKQNLEIGFKYFIVKIHQNSSLQHKINA